LCTFVFQKKFHALLNLLCFKNTTKTQHLKKVDYIIVGQGIAGTLLAWFLAQANKTFVIIEDGHKRCSTKIAAGIINPITGRRFVKSWRIEELLPFAKKTYQQIEQETKLALFKEFEIVRFFQTNAEGNNWLSKTSFEGYEAYLSTKTLTQDLRPYIKDTGGYGIVNGAQVAVGTLINFYYEYYKNKGQLIEELVDYEQIKLTKDQVNYKEIEAQKIIFCEGYSASKNPWLQQLPFESAKGEAFLLRIPDFKTDYIIKKTQFLVPLEEDLYWFGSNYEWNDLTDEPTEVGRAYLLERIAEILKVDYEIVEHVAAVRPVLKDRRPVIGLHPAQAEIGVFNGLGTKGTSIAPYWAVQYVQFLLGKSEVDAEVDFQRFFAN